MNKSNFEGRRRKAALLSAVRPSDEVRRCAVLGCARHTEASIKKGIAEFHCKYHVQHKSRHGSHWHPTYKARELAPYVKSAETWLKDPRNVRQSRRAIQDLEYALAFARQIEPVANLRGKAAKYRADVAFGRMRESSVTGARLVAIYLGVAALIDDDWRSHRVREFRIVQAAKVAHRLASGTHQTYEVWSVRTADYHPVTFHAYSRSSGLILREIGERLAAACDDLLVEAIPSIIALKASKFGEHSSHVPVTNAQRI